MKTTDTIGVNQASSSMMTVFLLVTKNRASVAAEKMAHMMSAKKMRRRTMIRTMTSLGFIFVGLWVNRQSNYRRASFSMITDMSIRG